MSGFGRSDSGGNINKNAKEINRVLSLQDLALTADRFLEKQGYPLFAVRRIFVHVFLRLNILPLYNE